MRVASIGAGYFARFQIAAWQRMEGVTLAAIADLDPDRLTQWPDLPTFTDTGAMLAEIQPDILDIATPPATHADLIKLAEEHKVPTLICQKPFTDSLETASKVARTQGDTTLIVHENFRFQPWYREISSLVRAGKIGRPIQTRFALRPGDGAHPDAYLDRQPYFRDMPRFLIRETGIHFIDTFRYLLGEPTAVYADLRRMNPAIRGEDCGHVIFDFGSDARALFDGDRTLDHAAGNLRLTMGEMEIEGTEAALRLTGDGAIRLRAQGSADWRLHGYDWTDRDFGGDCVQRFQEHVRDALTRGTPIETLAADYLRNIEIEALIYRSAAEGRKLTIPEARHA